MARRRSRASPSPTPMRAPMSCSRSPQRQPAPVRVPRCRPHQAPVIWRISMRRWNPATTDMVTLTVADAHGAADTVNLIFNVADNPATPVTLAGTTGKDVFFGTGNADQFVFAAHSNHDTIMNFTHGQDHIDLSAVVA